MLSDLIIESTDLKPEDTAFCTPRLCDTDHVCGAVCLSILCDAVGE